MNRPIFGIFSMFDVRKKLLISISITISIPAILAENLGWKSGDGRRLSPVRKQVGILIFPWCWKPPGWCLVIPD